MREAARIAAAIEILDLWLAGNDGLDHLVTVWGRRNRYAGAKDRAAIADRIYTVLRRRSECARRAGGQDGRGLVLGSLVIEDGLDGPRIDALFASARYGPPPLGAEEHAALARAPKPPAEPWLCGNYPEWLHPFLAQSPGLGLDAEMAAMARRAPLDLRVNRLKANPAQACAALTEDGLTAAPIPALADGLRLPTGAPVAASGAYRTGLVEPQDAGSQLACLLCGAKPGQTVVELAAGAGGKTLALAAAMGDRGRIVACDLDRRRLGRLPERAARAGAAIIETRPVTDWDAMISSAGDPDLDDLAQTADLVVLDVPCSGSGTWRRHPDQKWRLTASQLEALRLTQAKLLARGARLTRPGGALAYLTCSLLALENEQQMAKFEAARHGFRLLSGSEVLARASFDATCYVSEWGVRLSPAVTGTDGFFVGVLERVDAKP